MKKLRFISVLLLILFAVRSSVRPILAQSPNYGVYTNFIGQWTGHLISPDEAEVQGLRVSLSISLNKKQKKMRLDYVFGDKSNGGYSEDTKFVTIDVPGSYMEIKYEGRKPDRYEVEGIDSFAKVGLGTFSAKGVQSKDGRVITYRCFYNLEKDRFSYRWEQAEDGVHFVTTNIFMFVRQPPRDKQH